MMLFLGVAWLATFGIVLADWGTSSLIFMHNNTIVRIHGVASLPTAHVSVKVLHKLIEVESTSLCILKVFCDHMSSQSVCINY